MFLELNAQSFAAISDLGQSDHFSWLRERGTEGQWDSGRERQRETERDRERQRETETATESTYIVGDSSGYL